MYDLGVGTPLGLTALAYGLAGLTSGYVMSITPDPQWWLAAIFVAIGSAVGEGAIPVVKFLTGQEGWLTDRLFLVLPVVTVAATLLSPLMVPARPMVRRGQAAHVEGDTRMNFELIPGAARSRRLADNNGAMAIDKRTTRLGVLALVSMLLIGAVGTRLWFLQGVEAASYQDSGSRRRRSARC